MRKILRWVLLSLSASMCAIVCFDIWSHIGGIDAVIVTALAAMYLLDEIIECFAFQRGFEKEWKLK